MKVLFLDFDGVLNSSQWLSEVRTYVTGAWTNTNWFDPAAIARLNKIIEETGAKIVVSSSWRIGRTVLDLCKILFGAGFVGAIIGKITDELRRASEGRLRPEIEPVTRGEEIKIWLNAHPQVTHFAVVDDDSDMDLVRENFVQTDFETGLLDKHVGRIIALLNAPPCEMVDGPDDADCGFASVIRIQGLPSCARHLKARRNENDPEAYPETPL